MLVMNTITPDHADPGCACFLQAKLGLWHARVRHQAAMRRLDLRAFPGGPFHSRRHLPPRADRLQREALHADRRLLRRPQHRGPPGRRRRGRRGRSLARRPAGHPLHHPPRRRPARQGPLHRRARAAPWAAAEHVTHEDLEACRVHFRMDGKAVFQNGVEKMSEAIFECLRANGLTLGRHPGPRAAPGQPPHVGGDRRSGWASRGEKVYVNVEDYGNIASASLPIALDEVAAATGHDPPGQSRAAGGLRIGVRLGRPCCMLNAASNRRVNGAVTRSSPSCAARCRSSKRLILPGGRLGQLVDEDHGPRILVRRGLPLDELLQLAGQLRRPLEAVLEDHEGHGLEQPFVVGGAADAAFQDAPDVPGAPPRLPPARPPGR